ncbi:hypothetical protein LSCM4_03982 [Leishmania orientalis]|uniref:Ribosomal protein S29 n=2 Tax=Mundinia TaxID=2249475 RepID=A0A836HDD0_9TRYP|nr:hypothetical protein LSCM4_03982 [Leishmania orientalis]
MHIHTHTDVNQIRTKKKRFPFSSFSRFPSNMGHLDQWRSRQKIGMGKGSRCCVICSNQKALIRKYELNVCRQCFRENAEHIGFAKLR